eukprot:5566312-Pyramimonas_sp.AAC.1
MESSGGLPPSPRGSVSERAVGSEAAVGSVLPAGAVPEGSRQPVQETDAAAGSRPTLQAKLSER